MVRSATILQYMGDNKKEKITEAILLVLEKVADGYLYVDHIYRHPGSAWYGYDFPKSSLRNAVWRLTKRGLIENDINEGKIILKLTEAGRKWVIKRSKEDEVSWDGKWRLVIFDIPESHRKVRVTLRNKLKSWGFVLWQKSVWASRKNLTDELRKLIKDLGVQKWVLVIESNNVSN